MKYTTVNEWEHFDFSEAYISEIQKIGSYFQFTLDNVMIHPENTQNRDIRMMRANELYLKIWDGEIEALIEEGYKVYNADGKLMKQYEDKRIPQDSYNETLRSFTDGECCIYSLEKEGDTYLFTIDASNDRTYQLHISGTRDLEEWDRFLNR